MIKFRVPGIKYIILPWGKEMDILARIKARPPSRGREHGGRLARKGYLSPSKLLVLTVPLPARGCSGGESWEIRLLSRCALVFPSENMQPVVEVAQKHFSVSCCCFSLLLPSQKTRYHCKWWYFCTYLSKVPLEHQNLGMFHFLSLIWFSLEMER